MPTTTTGVATEFISFTRASNATVTDSNGRIDWAAHNLLLASEQFDASQWLKTNGTSTTPVVTANASAAPNGTTTADRVDFGAIDAATDYSVMYQTFTAVDTSYTAGVWVKAFAAGDVGRNVWLYLFDTANRGQITITLTANWQFVSTTATLTSGTRSWYISTLGSDFGGANQAATSVLVWGAHLYRSDLGGMQANTSAYPMYNPTTPKNLLGFTENFENAAWSKANTTVTGGVVAPNGLSTAFRIEASPSAGAGQQFYQNSTVVGSGPYVCSIYAKQGSGPTDSNSFLVYNNTTVTIYAAITINYVTGAITQTTGSGASATNVGNGWWRISIPFTSTATVGNTVRFYAGSVGAVETPGEFFYAWGAQLSDSASLDPYVANHFAAPSAAAYYGPRLDFDGATLSAKGLLVEEQRSNLLQNSVKMTSVSVTSGTRIIDQLVSPDGTTNASIFQGTGSGAATFAQNVTATATTLTMSCYVKVGLTSTRSTFLFLMRNSTTGIDFTPGSFSTSTGAITGTGWVSTSVGNNWYRISYTNTGAQTVNVNDTITLYWGATGGAVYATTDQLGIYGGQVEAGSFATSYIPTGAATATRSADVAQVSTAAFPYSATEGTLVVSVTKDFLGGDAVSAALYSGGSSDTMELFFNSADSRLYAATGGITQVNLIDTGKVAAGATTKAGFAYSANNYALSTNGGTVVTDTSATVPPVTALGIGSRAGSLPFRGWIRQITYIPRRLTNAELQTRTSA